MEDNIKNNKKKAGHLVIYVIFLFLMIAIPPFAYGAIVRISWEESREPGVAGYSVYYGTSSMTYTQSLDIGSCIDNIEIGDLDEGYTYYFAVTAYDSGGNESAYSEEVSVFIPGEDSPTDDPSLPLSAASGGGEGGGCFISTAGIRTSS
ncbi:MAG: fibronectin type III domain-containing protein [Thermodesulfobacteriota bacterium]|nr:fibronectin type III domain-containing protein [Thermodesulfobacteriota bacterium]